MNSYQYRRKERLTDTTDRYLLRLSSSKMNRWFQFDRVLRNETIRSNGTDLHKKICTSYKRKPILLLHLLFCCSLLLLLYNFISPFALHYTTQQHYKLGLKFIWVLAACSECLNTKKRKRQIERAHHSNE